MRKVESRWLALAAAVLSLAATGCDWLPVRRRLDPALYPVRSPSAEPIATQALDVAVPPPATSLASLPAPTVPSLIPVSDDEALREGGPTPLLDAALVKASAIREATLPEEPPDDPPPTRHLRVSDTPPTVSVTHEGPLPAELVPPAPLHVSVVLDDHSPAADVPATPSPPDVNEPAPSVPPTLPSEMPASPAAPVSSPDLAPWDQVMVLIDEASGDATVDGASGSDSVDSERAAGSLTIPDLRLCRSVEGFAKFEELDAAHCESGQRMIVYCELDGVGYRARDDAFRSDLETRLSLLAQPSGDVVWSEQKKVEDTAGRPRVDFYVSYVIKLPEGLSPGDYTIRLVQSDAVGGGQAQRDVPLTIRPASSR